MELIINSVSAARSATKADAETKPKAKARTVAEPDPADVKPQHGIRRLRSAAFYTTEIRQLTADYKAGVEKRRTLKKYLDRYSWLHGLKERRDKLVSDYKKAVKSGNHKLMSKLHAQIQTFYKNNHADITHMQSMGKHLNIVPKIRAAMTKLAAEQAKRKTKLTAYKERLRLRKEKDAAKKTSGGGRQHKSSSDKPRPASHSSVLTSAFVTALRSALAGHPVSKFNPLIQKTVSMINALPSPEDCNLLIYGQRSLVSGTGPDVVAVIQDLDGEIQATSEYPILKIDGRTAKINKDGAVVSCDLEQSLYLDHLLPD